jgi:tetratricopeptide (TPR) repeat protein
MKIKTVFIVTLTALILGPSLTVHARESSRIPRISEALAYYFYQKGEFPLAIREYRKLASSQENNARYYYNLGCLYTKLKSYPDAIRAFKKAARSNILRKDACYNLAVIYGKHLKNTEKADIFYCRYQDAR